MFGTFLIIAVTIMQGYVFWRIYSIPFVKARISPAALNKIAPNSPSSVDLLLNISGMTCFV